MTLVFTRHQHHAPDLDFGPTLSLTAEERTRSRLHCHTDAGDPIYLALPRGVVLQEGDRLLAVSGEQIQILAKPEAVMTVTAIFPLALLQAAYHLGNRHVPLEITATYLRLTPDPVLRDLLMHRGLSVTAEHAPFQPESGAYGGQVVPHRHSDHHHSDRPHDA